MSKGFNNITIIGDGAMGTVCGVLFNSNGLNVKIWGYDPKEIQEFISAGENTRYLPGYKLDKAIKFTSDDDCMSQADLIVSAVPCQFVRRVWQRLKPFVPAGIPIVSITKGIENDTLKLPTQIIDSVLQDSREYATLSGPNISDELIRKLPATACVACENIELAEKLQHTFNTSWFRVYSTDDIIGVQLAGALKNVIAIAAGIIDGIGAGDNAKAALLARGLAEIARLGGVMGANEHTFAGLTGLGDLVTTCISPTGRNRSFGENIGKGMDTKTAIGKTNSVVEGVTTCRSVIELAKKEKVEMPIAQAVYDIIEGIKSVDEALKDLMTRDLKQE
ncbi:MAG: NAD(P)H-dependent glycerol-3-phosphate dehydrogenase [Sedimentisphaeraceae bacterium JB056]